MQKLDLPEPSVAEKQHSNDLLDIICQQIELAGGWIDFAHYMELALYAPAMGYYSAGQQKFGEAGDFITAPEISPLFAQTLAKPVADVLSHMGKGSIIEFGAGSGKLAADLLIELQQQQALPEKYLIVELSAELKKRQQQTLQNKIPDFFARVQWLDRLPDKPLNAVVLANEVLDAMPVQRFVKTQQGVQTLGVRWENNALSFATQASAQSLVQSVQRIEQDIMRQLSADYRSEINLNIQPWLQSIGNILNQGAVYLIDYGYPRAEYYAMERHMGTMMCYCRHRALDDALYLPGLLDITAFVDFTAVAEAGLDTGFEINGFTSQAHFLINCGLAQRVEQRMSDDIKTHLPLVQQMKTLTLSSEMGERFKVMGLNKNIDMILPGFTGRDFRNRL
jgi:SAM-dependent MidA family methyltransferase